MGRADHILAIDQGTTSTRAILFDSEARPVAVAQRELEQFYPDPGLVEHDPDRIWTDTLAVVREALSAVEPERVAGIGIANQRETVVLWSRATSEPIHRAIVWQDRRTADECARLRASGAEEMVGEKTGLLLDPYFSATKIAWLLDNIPGARAVAERGELACGTIDSFLLWRLTGGEVHATDVTNAARTSLFDIRAGEWDDDLCRLFRVPQSLLPEVHDNSRIFGSTASGLFDRQIPIGGMAGDQQAALFGQACFAPGDTKNTYGTGSFVLMNVGSTCPEPAEGLLTTVAWSIPDGTGGTRTDYAFEGAIFSTGSAIQWLRDGLGIIADAKEAGPLAASVATTDDVFFVPAFTGLGSPWWDPYARGTLVGVTRGTTKAHLTRAVIESMALQTRDVVDAMCEHSGHPVAGLRADGGAAVMDLLMQLQADQLGVPVRRPQVQETTALGAAYLAGLAEGVWSSTDDIEANWALDAEFTPSADRSSSDALHRRWLQAVEHSCGWANSAS
ncbi:MAG: glycerol kinase GlpK [Aquihabitans sp.]